MNAAVLEAIAALVQSESLLSFSGHKSRLLCRGIEERMAALTLPDMNSYLEYLQASTAEVTLLLGLLTVNETSFFRNQRQFDFLMETIIPQIEAVKGEALFRSSSFIQNEPGSQRQSLRVLCAGCSTGEEPYSVAVAMLESLRFVKAWDVTILAGDLDENCLKIARDGWYHDSRVNKLPLLVRNRYMEAADGGWRFREEVKRLITYCRLNLKDFIAKREYMASEFGIESFDMIFCRNVMIYFQLESQQMLIDALFRSLVPGGYLFTGDAEPLHMYEHEFQPVQSADCLIYQKKS